MTHTDALTPKFVETFPTPLEEGFLYVSIPFATCAHLCCCGCGTEVVTPLSPARWALTYDGVNVSLSPSVGGWRMACRSHYWIRRGRIEWSRDLSQAEVDEVIARDERDFISDLQPEATQARQQSWLRRRRWLRRRLW